MNISTLFSATLEERLIGRASKKVLVPNTIQNICARAVYRNYYGLTHAQFAKKTIALPLLHCIFVARLRKKQYPNFPTELQAEDEKLFDDFSNKIFKTLCGL